MEIFQEPTFTAFVALVLSIVVAKIVSFAICSSGTDCDCVVEGGVGKGLRVGKRKGEKKRVKFVDDVVVRRVDCYQGFEDGVLLDGAVVESVGEVIERVDVSGLNELLSEDLGGNFIDEQKVGMLVEGESDGVVVDEGFGVEEKDPALVDPQSLVVEEKGNGGELGGDEMVSDQKEEDEIVTCGENEGFDKEEAKNERVVVDDDDDEDNDWEGIERSELEKVFAEAVNYVECGGKGKRDDDLLAKLGGDVQMQLYGLHKVAVEGRCHEPQPMALKVLARAKWNAWQRLGSVDREAAMEQYIRILSDSIPDWMHDHSADDYDIHVSPDLETVGRVSVPEHDREPELGAPRAGGNVTGNTENKV